MLCKVYIMKRIDVLPYGLTLKIFEEEGKWS